MTPLSLVSHESRSRAIPGAYFCAILGPCLFISGGPISSLPQIVPYRDSKLTHLFKNHFEGEG